MKTLTILLLSYFFGDKINPIYTIIGLNIVIFAGLYFYWKKNKSN